MRERIWKFRMNRTMTTSATFCLTTMIINIRGSSSTVAIMNFFHEAKTFESFSDWRFSFVEYSLCRQKKFSNSFPSTNPLFHFTIFSSQTSSLWENFFFLEKTLRCENFANYIQGENIARNCKALPSPAQKQTFGRFRMKNSRENLDFPPMHRPHQSFHFHTKSFSEFSTKRKLLKHCLESFPPILIDFSELYLLKLCCFHCCKIEFPLNLWFLNFFPSSSVRSVSVFSNYLKAAPARHHPP